ncbi:MAG: protein phosphatase 2C domain-containing protein [Polyangiaceae bacterium]
MSGALLEVAERTDPGRDPDKQVNEDTAAQRITKHGHLLVVCDGMGGHAGGQEASRLAVATIIQSLESTSPGTAPGPALAQAIFEAGRRVFEMGGAGPQAGRPGSTCVAFLVHTGAVEVAHVGDSRGYFIRNGHIWPLTKDHSVVQQMLDQGAITPEQAVLHPEGNKITRALGMKPDTDVELRDPPLLQAVGDIFILASDGLCDLVRTDEIGSVVVQAASLDLAGQNLVAMANARGGHDNITVLLARVLPGGAAGSGNKEPLAPTIVEHTGAPVPEKTLVDHPQIAPAAPLHPAIPVVPHTPQQPSHPAAHHPAHGAAPPGAPFAPPHGSGPPYAPPVQPSNAPITAPLAISDLPAGAHAPPRPPATIPPAPPSRGGLIVGMSILMLLLLGGVAVWWVLRGR